jgi:hypothetical protein
MILCWLKKEKPLEKRLKKLALRRTTLLRLDSAMREELLQGVWGGSEELEKKVNPPGETSVQISCEV